MKITLFYRLFDQTPYVRVKRFLQTVFGNILMGSYLVQRNRNIAAATPLSGLVPNSKSGIRALLKNGRRIFFENPKPRCRERTSWIYFSYLQALRSTIPICKRSAIARCNKELEPATFSESSYWHSLYNKKVIRFWHMCKHESGLRRLVSRVLVKTISSAKHTKVRTHSDGMLCVKVRNAIQ